MNASTQAWIQEMIKKAPPLGDHQKDELRRLLRLKKPEKKSAA